MATAPEQSTAPKLPASADFNAIYNRISLASAKQSTFLNSMRAKYPSLARPSTATSSSLAPTADPNGTFSSLKKPTSTLPTTTPSTRARAVADDSDLRFENPNTGLGYSAPRSEEKASAATRDLSRRLLGKRGRETEQKTATQKRKVQEEESEEEEGRSGLGRKKKRRIRTEDEDASPEAEVDEAPPAGVKSREGADAQGDIPDSNSEAPVADGEQEEHTANPSVAEAEAENEQAHKKKKKKKKNTRKANVVAPV